MKKTTLLLLILCLAQMTGAQNFSVNQPADNKAFTSSNLPIVIINTNGQEIKDEPKITADMGIIYNGEGKRNYLTDSFNNYNGKIAIEIRGSSSQMFPKKQYGFNTVDSAGEDLDVQLLGFPSEHTWILSAQYNDKSLMRDVLSFYLADQMGHYASRTKYCEVVLNGDYRGVYILMEKIKRGKNRVSVSKISSADVAGDALTGGYIIKVDKPEGSSTDGWYSSYRPYTGAWQKTRWQYHYPEGPDLAPQQVKYIQSYIGNIETVMASSAYTDSLAGYPKLINVESFADVFLLNELNKNVDGFRLSSFFYKDKDSKGGKLCAGPIWDFNLGFGNCDYYDASTTQDWQLDYQFSNQYFLAHDEFVPPFWWKKIWGDPDFKKKVAARFMALQTNLLSAQKIGSVIDSLSSLLNEAQVRNFQKWQILGSYVWPNSYVGETYADEVKYLKNWITVRLHWMNWALSKYTDVADESGSELPAGYSLSQNYPNPFNPATIIGYDLPFSGDVGIKVYDNLGREVDVLFSGFRSAGHYSAAFNAGNLPSGVYYYKMTAGGNIITKKMILIK